MVKIDRRRKVPDCILELLPESLQGTKYWREVTRALSVVGLEVSLTYELINLSEDTEKPKPVMRPSGYRTYGYTSEAMIFVDRNGLDRLFPEEILAYEAVLKVIKKQINAQK